MKSMWFISLVFVVQIILVPLLALLVQIRSELALPIAISRAQEGTEETEKCCVHKVAAQYDSGFLLLLVANSHTAVRIYILVPIIRSRG